MCMSRGTTWSLGEIQMRHSCILKSRFLSWRPSQPKIVFIVVFRAQHVSVGQSEGFWPLRGREQGWRGVRAGGGCAHQVRPFPQSCWPLIVGNCTIVQLNKGKIFSVVTLLHNWICLCAQDSAEEWKEDTDYCSGMGPRPRLVRIKLFRQKTGLRTYFI